MVILESSLRQCILVPEASHSHVGPDAFRTCPLYNVDSFPLQGFGTLYIQCPILTPILLIAPRWILYSISNL